MAVYQNILFVIYGHTDQMRITLPITAAVPVTHDCFLSTNQNAVPLPFRLTSIDYNGGNRERQLQSVVALRHFPSKASYTSRKLAP